MRWLTARAQPESYPDVNIDDLDVSDINEPQQPQPQPQQPLQEPAPRAVKSVLTQYDTAVENQILQLSESRIDLEYEIARLSQQLHETKAAISGLTLARTSWSNQIPKQPIPETPEDHNADRIDKALRDITAGANGAPDRDIGIR